MSNNGHYASTEWGVISPWGTHPASDREAATTTARNMRTAGHDARIVWRGVTNWLTDDADEATS